MLLGYNDCFVGIWLYDSECIIVKGLNPEYELELNISMVTSVCFQELTVYFEYDDDGYNCKCSIIQVTAELNHLQCLINENRYLNNMSSDYDIYVKTDDGTESNSLDVTCSANTVNSVDIMTMSSSLTSNQSKAVYIY